MGHCIDNLRKEINEIVQNIMYYHRKRCIYQPPHPSKHLVNSSVTRLYRQDENSKMIEQRWELTSTDTPASVPRPPPGDAGIILIPTQLRRRYSPTQVTRVYKSTPT